MDKRYQVFVSSTFEDLKVERSKIMQTLIQMDCFPSGMEMFPAIDEDQWEYIKKAIDECDYYILVIAGRYGSVDEDNISYTEKEYDYALGKRKPILALLHENPDSISSGNTDKDDKKSYALEKFRKKVQTGRLVKKWKNADELSAQAVLGMLATIQRFPSSGWVKGSTMPSEKDFEDVFKVNKENDLLKEKIVRLEKLIASPVKSNKDLEGDLAGLSEPVSVIVTSYTKKKEVVLTWRDAFVVVATQLERNADEDVLKGALSNLVSSLVQENENNSYALTDASFDMLMIQFRALGYVDILDNSDFDSYRSSEYYLTDYGTKTMLENLAIKSSTEKV